MTALAVQSLSAFLAIFGFSIILDVPKKYLIYAGAAGGACWFVYLLALQSGRSQSGGINPEPYFCKTLKGSGNGVSGGRHPSDRARSVRVPLRLFYDTGSCRSLYLSPDTDDTDSGSYGSCHFHCGFPVPPAPEELEENGTGGQMQFCSLE